MNLTIIGASAGLGLETAQAALTRGHSVTTLSRSVDTLQGRENLTALQGSATSPADTKRAVTGADAVIVTLGTKSMGATTLFSEAAAALNDALAGSTIPVIVVTGFGAGDSAKYQNRVLRAIMMGLLGRMYADKGRMEKIITSTPLQWEIVQPGVLSNKDAVGSTSGITSFTKGMKVPGISRKDLAAFLVEEAEKRRYIRQFVIPTAGK